jgi:hypothetical protein
MLTRFSSTIQVKADRGEAKSLDDIVEAEQEPRLDEM